MFKSLQLRVVTIFVILVSSVMIIIGTFLVLAVSDFYHNRFKEDMQSYFDSEIVDQINKAASGQGASDKISNILKAYSGRLGISRNRNYYVLDGYTGNVLNSSAISDNIDKSSNIITAMSGKVGEEVTIESTYMDYALPIFANNEIKYIIYINDTKEELSDIIKDILSIIFEALAIAALVSGVLGYFLAKTITAPITNLTHHADMISGGNFDQKIDVHSDDEIGRLSDTFNNMTFTLKQTLADIENEKNKIETILLYMTDGVLAFDFEGKVIHINPEAKKMLDIENEQNIIFDEFFKEIGVDISLGELLYLEHYDIITREMHTKTSDLRGYFAVFNVEKGNGGVIVVLQDVTQQQKLEMSRREFVANVSHELRTPLTTIKSYSETLYDGASQDPEMTNKFLSIILNETDRMIRIVQDLLVLSRLDFSKAEMHKDMFSLLELIETVVDKLQIKAKEKGHILRYKFVNKVSDIFGDKHRLEQVLDNIIGNAIKYTQNGGRIDVFVGKVYNDIYIKVIDTGIGIPNEDVPRIFDRFYRVDKARSREYGGTGLGLAIAREIVEAHNGTIKITSEQGKGTEVIILLPALIIDKGNYRV